MHAPKLFMILAPKTALHILVLRELRVLMKIRIPLKLVQGGVRIVAHSISSHCIDSIKTSLLFSYTVGSLYF